MIWAFHLTLVALPQMLAASVLTVSHCYTPVVPFDGVSLTVTSTISTDVTLYSITTATATHTVVPSTTRSTTRTLFSTVTVGQGATTIIETVTAKTTTSTVVTVFVTSGATTTTITPTVTRTTVASFTPVASESQIISAGGAGGSPPNDTSAQYLAARQKENKSLIRPGPQANSTPSVACFVALETLHTSVTTLSMSTTVTGSSTNTLTKTKTITSPITVPKQATKTLRSTTTVTNTITASTTHTTTRTRIRTATATAAVETYYAGCQNSNIISTVGGSYLDFLSGVQYLDTLPNMPPHECCQACQLDDARCVGYLSYFSGPCTLLAISSDAPCDASTQNWGFDGYPSGHTYFGNGICGQTQFTGPYQGD